MEGCLVSPGEVRDWGQVWTQLLWGVWEPVLLPWWVLGLRSWCQGSPVPGGVRILLGTTWARANSLGREKLPTKGGGGVGFVSSLPPKPSGGDLHPRPGSLALYPASKCLFLLKSVIFKFINIYSSCIFIFWEGHVDTESSSPVPTPLCAIKLRSIFPKMSTQGSVSLGCLVSFAPG